MKIKHLVMLLCIALFLSAPVSAASKKTVYVLTKVVIANSENTGYNRTINYKYTDGGLIESEKSKGLSETSTYTYSHSYKYDENNNLISDKYTHDNVTGKTKFYYKNNKVYKAKVPNWNYVMGGASYDGTYSVNKYKWNGENQVAVAYGKYNTESIFRFDALGRKYWEHYNNERVLIYDSNGFCIKDWNGGLERNWTIKKFKGTRLLEADWVQNTYRGTFTAKYTYKKIKVDKKVAKKVKLQQASIIINGRPLEMI